MGMKRIETKGIGVIVCNLKEDNFCNCEVIKNLVKFKKMFDIIVGY